jgi:DNA-binding LytR/AlgR family response regulator
MEYNVLIVESNQTYAKMIAKTIQTLPMDIECYLSAALADAYQAAHSRRIHLFILDVILDTRKSGDVSGLIFAKNIREHHRYQFTPIIFITTLEDPRLYTYSQLHCYDYIEKPFDEGRLKQAVQGALQMPSVPDDEKCVYFRKDGIIYSKHPKEIVWIEISRKQLQVHCVDEKLEVAYKPSEEILQELDSDSFFRCSRFAIVNRNFIRQIDFTNRYIRLRHYEKPVEIGSSMKKRVRQELTKEDTVYSNKMSKKKS